MGKGSRGAGVGCGRAGALPERMEPALAMAVLQCEQQRANAARDASAAQVAQDVQVFEGGSNTERTTERTNIG